MKRYNPFIYKFFAMMLICGALAIAPMAHRVASPDADQSNGLISWIGSYDLVAHDRAGNEIWRETIHNALLDEGEEAFLDVFLRGATAPTTFYIRLFNDTPAETDAISNLTGEPSGNGYAAEEVERSNTGWPTLALDSGDYQATSKTVTFEASGGSIGPVTYCVLTTSTDSSGLLISAAALSTTRTLADGESLDVTYNTKLQ